MSERAADTAWETAFVAMSVALGEPPAATFDALGEASLLRADDLVRTLRSEGRGARAKALALAIGAVVVDATAMRLM